MTERLDRIEAILLQLSQRQDRFQVQLEQSTQQLSQRQDRFQVQLEQFNQQTRQLIQDTARDLVSLLSTLASDLDALNANVNAYIAQSNAFLASEQRDRAEFRQQMVGLQTETRNILRELAQRRQSQNGDE